MNKANDISFELKKSEEELKINIFDRYVGSIVQNYNKNEKKAKLLKKAYFLLFSGIITLIISLMIFIVLQFFIGG